MTNARFNVFVLSIYPTSRGFAFVLFEGPASPFDWGTKEFRGRHKNMQTLRAVAAIIDRYRPEVLVIEDFTVKGSRRSSRIRKLYRALTHLAETEQVDVQRISRTQVRLCFASVGATTKHEIAMAIAKQILALAHRLPRTRKIWMSEDPRQNLFDAAAIGLTYFANCTGNDHPMPLA